MRRNFMSRYNIPLLIALLSTGLVSCREEGYRKTAGAVWGTAYNITYRADRGLDDSVRLEMRRVELSLSAFCDSSVVSRVNRGELSEVDSAFAEVFAEAKRVAAASGGAFDPTVWPLVDLWGFGRRKVVGEPSRARIDSALATVGIRECRLDGLRLVRRHPDTKFDFSAIAKGYGCDRVAAMLRRNGCRDYLVEIGGEIAAGGVSPRGVAWRVMVDAPVVSDTPVHERMAVIGLPSGGGVATSGNYRNYRETPSGRVGHTIDPHTGYPRRSAMLSATVVAPSCMTADALATACMAMEPDSAMAMIRSMSGVEALLVSRDSIGGMAMAASPGFPRVQ